MGLFSSLFGSQPAWHRALPPHIQFTNEALITDLERLRNELGLDDQVFMRALVLSKTVMVRNLHGAYREAQRQLPGRPQSDYFGMVIGDRILKKIMTHDVNASPTALSRQELEGIIHDLEGIAARCSTLDDVIGFLIDIENREQHFEDPFGYIARVDAACSRYHAA